MIPDGVRIVHAHRLINNISISRITGSDIFKEVNTQLNETGGFVFLGSTNETLNLICQKFSIEYPSVKIVGTISALFKSGFDPETLALLRGWKSPNLKICTHLLLDLIYNLKYE